MTITTVSSREFNQDADGAKKAAQRGGRPAHVLLSIEDYQRLVGNQANIAELLAMHGKHEIEFEPPRLREGLRRPAKLR